MRYFQIVMISAMFVTVVGMIALPREWSNLWVLGTVVVTAATFQVTRMAMKAVRRRWVRARVRP